MGREALLAEREDRDRTREAIQQLIQQTALLPAGTIRGAKAHQDVIGRKVSKRVLESQHRVIGSDRSVGFSAEFFDLAENVSKPLVGLLACLVGCGGEPLEASR